MNNNINYIEFWTTDINKVKEFYSTVFWWKFQDFWDKYTSFSNSWINWWFELVDSISSWWSLVIISHNNLEEVIERIKKYWWVISMDIFSFPGWKRFQFIDPVWNNLAVWSETE